MKFIALANTKFQISAVSGRSHWFSQYVRQNFVARLDRFFCQIFVAACVIANWQPQYIESRPLVNALKRVTIRSLNSILVAQTLFWTNWRRLSYDEIRALTQMLCRIKLKFIPSVAGECIETAGGIDDCVVPQRQRFHCIIARVINLPHSIR